MPKAIAAEYGSTSSYMCMTCQRFNTIITFLHGTDHSVLMDHTPWLLQFITHSVYSVYVGKKSCEFYNNVSAVYWLLCTAASFTESAQPHHFLTTSKFHQALDLSRPTSTITLAAASSSLQVSMTD